MKAVMPKNEAERLAALDQYAILDTPAEQAFDDITCLAAQICNTPIALVSLVDANRQWFKSKIGLSVEETDRDIAFCSHTILSGENLLIVPNALADERFATNPLVTSTPYIRFYAGAPLVTPEGLSIGSLCVIDYVARDLNSEQIEALRVLSNQVIAQLELKRKLSAFQRSTIENQRSQAALKKVASENRVLAQAVASVSQGVLITDPNQPHNPIIYINQAFCQMTGYQPEEVIGKNARFLQGIANTQALAPSSDTDTQPQATLVNYRKDGQPFWNEVKTTPVFSQQGELQYVVGTSTDISDRVMAQAQLNWHSALVRTMTSASPLAFYVVDNRTDAIIYFNHRFCEIWGIEHLEEQMQRGKLKNQEIIPHCVPLIADISAVEFIEALHESNCCVVEEEIELVDNRTIRHFSTQIRDEQDLYFGRLYLFEDISERKSAEKAIRESEARFRTMADTAPVMIWMSGIDKLCNYFNQGWLEFTGRKLEQELGNGWVEGVHPDDMEFCINTYSTAFDTQQKFKMEYRLRRNDGEYRWILDTGTPRLNSDGSFAGYIGSCIDITDHKQAQEKIREQAALLDVTTDAILVRDLNHQILFWNSGAERLYGYMANEAIATSAIELVEFDLPKLEQILKTVIITGEWSGELNKVTKLGKQITVESRWTLMRDQQGLPKSILCVDTDITEKKQLLSQFLRAQRLESIGTLASGIAHDLNNVLTPILISAQLLQMKIADEQSRLLLHTMENNAKRGAALIKQVLSFARGVEGKRTILQMGHLVAEFKQIVKQTFPKSICVYTDVAPNLWTVCGDATQLHQVLMNLCVNARDAMPEGGNLEISAENLLIDENYARMHLEAKVGTYIVITVADTGVGMPPEVVERIFEPFFTTKQIGEGTGLGLSTVMGIVKGHGGFVNVYSEVGRGTKFQVYLPAVEGIEKQRSRMKLPTGQGELILVVDDEAAIRETTKTSLEAYNYKVLTASDGIEAIAVYVQHRKQISLVLIDLMMPLMDGFTTIRTLQKLNPAVKIIAMSGLTSNAQVAATLSSGVKTFLPKPYTTSELLKYLHELLKIN